MHRLPAACSRKVEHTQGMKDWRNIKASPLLPNWHPAQTSWYWKRLEDSSDMNWSDNLDLCREMQFSSAICKWLQSQRRNLSCVLDELGPVCDFQIMWPPRVLWDSAAWTESGCPLQTSGKIQGMKKKIQNGIKTDQRTVNSYSICLIQTTGIVSCRASFSIFWKTVQCSKIFSRIKNWL